MAKYPLTVKGLRRQYDGLVDNALEALQKFNKAAEAGDTLEAGGTMSVTGGYAVNKDGELGLILSVQDANAAMALVDGDLEVGLTMEWDKQGESVMETEFRCIIHATKGE